MHTFCIFGVSGILFSVASMHSRHRRVAFFFSCDLENAATGFGLRHAPHTLVGPPAAAELEVATILIAMTRVATVMTAASVDVDQPSCDIVVSMSIGSSAGTTRAFEGTGIVVEQSSVTASTPNRRNSGHRCAARGRTGPPLEDRSGEPVAGT